VTGTPNSALVSATCVAALRAIHTGSRPIAALTVSFDFQLPPAARVIVLCGVIFSMVGIRVLVIRSRIKNLTDRPNMVVLPDAAAGVALSPQLGSPRRKPPR
jgi:hypothetical protein